MRTVRRKGKNLDPVVSYEANILKPKWLEWF